MYFDFLYGILFDDRIITRKTQKSHRNTENIKNRLDWIDVVPSPAPTPNPRNSTEFTERGPGVEEWETFFFQKRIAFILFLIPGDAIRRRVYSKASPRDSQIKDLVASLSTCSAEVVDFVANPPPLRPPLRAACLH